MNSVWIKTCNWPSFQFFVPLKQVGVQTEVEPDAGANALEDRVNAVLPLQNKDDDDDGDDE